MSLVDCYSKYIYIHDRVGSAENENLGKFKVESSFGEVTER